VSGARALAFPAVSLQRHARSEISCTTMFAAAAVLAGRVLS
jgi:hypothetical protein